jgi:hypothetical protein
MQPSHSSVLSARQPRIKFDFIADNKPDNLPSAEQIIRRCKEANAVNLTTGMRGVALVDGSKDGTPYAWVKYGRSITMAEARRLLRATMPPLSGSLPSTALSSRTAGVTSSWS